MKLWTWHRPDFSLLHGCVDHRRSEYWQTVPGVPAAYDELACRLETDQVVWCYTIPNQRIVLPHHTEVEWILEVPCEAILKFVDGIVWNRILGIRCALPNAMRYAWKDQALRRYPYDVRRRHSAEEELEELFWAQPPQNGSWWDNLLVEGRSEECIRALVPHPCRLEWVLVNPLSEA